MTPEEYGSCRDEFTAAHKWLEAVEMTCFETLNAFPEDDDVAAALDEGGYWISGDDFKAVENARKVLERLIGKAHARSAEARELLAA